MKYRIQIIILIFFTLIQACKNKKKVDSFEPLINEYVDFVPFLMTKANIDSVYLIIKNGETNNLKKGDTLSIYTSIEKKQIKEFFRGFMCCNNVYEFDSLGLLVFEEKATDVSQKWNYSWSLGENKIFQTRVDKELNLIDTIVYKLENEKLKERTDFSIFEKRIKKYEYNSISQLSKTVEKTSPTQYQSDEDVFTKSFEWNGKNLKKTIKILRNQKTITYFDSTGFPKLQTYILNFTDTLCEVEIIKIKAAKNKD